jgi:crotonobetaine/carnitine-CoA ligase
MKRPAETVAIRLDSGSDPLQIIYTSGTTGDPKGVVMENGRFGGLSLLGRVIFQFAPDEKLYTGLSLTHGNAQAVTLSSALAIELPAVLSRRFTKSRLWDVCRRHGCTTFSMLGGMATAIYSEPVRDDDADNPVRMVTSAGMPHAIWEAFEKRFGVKIFEWYGTVEGGLAFKPIGKGPMGSFGKPAPGLDMKILDKGGKVSAFVLGRLCATRRKSAVNTGIRKSPGRRPGADGFAAATSATGTKRAGSTSTTARAAASAAAATS